MKIKRCNNPDCEATYEDNSKNFAKNGSYKTKNGHKVQVYKCKKCGRRLTERKAHVRRQRKPWLLRKIWELSCRGMSQRDIASFLGCNRKTVARKMEQAAELIREYHFNRLKKVKYGLVYFDEMQSFYINKKSKIVIGVLCSGGKVLDFSIGHYSPSHNRPVEVPDRKDEIKKLFRRSRDYLVGDFNLITDKDTLYAPIVQEVFKDKKHNHHQYSRDEALLLPKDPLLVINNVHGSMRHRISRLQKKGQVTPKSIRSLRTALFLYLGMFNRYKAIDFQKTHIKRGKDPEPLAWIPDPTLEGDWVDVTHDFLDSDKLDVA